MPSFTLIPKATSANLFPDLRQTVALKSGLRPISKSLAPMRLAPPIFVRRSVGPFHCRSVPLFGKKSCALGLKTKVYSRSENGYFSGLPHIPLNPQPSSPRIPFWLCAIAVRAPCRSRKNSTDPDSIAPSCLDEPRVGSLSVPGITGDCSPSLNRRAIAKQVNRSAGQHRQCNTCGRNQPPPPLETLVGQRSD